MAKGAETGSTGEDIEGTGPATPDPCPIPEQGHVGRAGLLCLDPRRRFSQAHPMPPKVRYPVLGLWVSSPTLNVAGA